jgi:hypothetical protein
LRLYMAQPRADAPGIKERMFAEGCRRALVSFGLLRGSSGNEKLKTYVTMGAASPGGFQERAAAETGMSKALLSYADVDESWGREAFEFWVSGHRAGMDVFLDSGAFSAYTRGSVIDLDRYCDYIQEHETRLTCYAALDVIKDWRGTQRNLERMAARGLRPIPTFHRGSPWEVLDELAGSCPYIALGGMVGGRDGNGRHDSLIQESAGPYLDECWRRLERYWPIKVHVFGIIAQWILERYPFYSADSSSPILGAGMGRVTRFRAGRMRSLGWIQDVTEIWDGSVADHVAEDRVERSGSAHIGRRLANIRAVLSLERYVTDLWAARGVTW